MSENKPVGPGRGAPDRATAAALRRALIRWFRENGRDLPWRRTRDPYRILVSEVMLQQIQVPRAIPFYLAFLERFPTLEALAEAPLSEAIRVWGDLGRYRRVVGLHRTARLVVEEHAGEIPADPDVLVKLPGIGPYTAGAVACFAFERDAPFVDTNMRRVLHRLFFGPDVPERTASEGELLALAAALVPRGGGWEWNQALMELGALRCTARKPLCETCPVGEVCRARPRMPASLATVPRGPKPGKKPYRYEDSNRYYRGRALAKLREASEEGIMLRDLGASLREGFADRDVPWVRDIVRSLEKDGLAVITGERTGPAAGAVAEERPAYGVEPGPGGTDADDGAARVRLP